MVIPRSHPRYQSLVVRERLADGLRKGLVHETGLIAHGRGEAFDYLIGEKTVEVADEAAKVAAAALLLANDPAISLNGNVVALASRDCISLANKIPAKLEVNLFHRTNDRVKRLVKELKKQGAKKVYGRNADALIPGLNHDRALCEKEGIYGADVVLVPLEDGDRCEALKKMGKTVLTIDLNPLSRTAWTADVTVVDNIVRALPNIEKWVVVLKNRKKEMLKNMVESWDNNEGLRRVLDYISKRLKSL
ncbi:MAG TPA: phosphopantothenate/pantothenate synthetase [Thermoplasmatales archaeon]|nr:phosphopantothenate/pantothenate synthetase [Thermoplasmatales archaeon]